MSPEKNKIIAIGGAIAFLAAATGYAFSTFVSLVSVPSFVASAVLSILFLITFVFGVMLIDHFKVMLAVVGLSTAVIAVWFIGKMPLLALLVATVLLFIYLLYAYRSGNSAVQNAFKIKFVKIAKPIFDNAATGLALFALILYFSSISFTDASNYFFRLTERSFEIARQFLPSDLQQGLSVEVQKQLQTQAAQQLYDLTFGQILSLPEAQQNLILIGVGILAFLAFRGVILLGNWGLVWIGAVGFQTLKGAKFFNVALEDRSKEVLILSTALDTSSSKEEKQKINKQDK